MSNLLTTLTIADLVGIAGTIIVTAAYFATQMRYLNSDDLLFPIVNLFGSLFIAYSLVFAFNFASVLMEFFWILISLAGIANYLRRKKA
ncbi:MAG: hypothetical protein GQ535_01775 [Rhodobacteraceae bacterium]|nr:hypothetical protein [Paracoccaceae bacterium]